MASDDGHDDERGQEVQQIADSVRNEVAHQDETTPDGLAYHVNTFELEVERFLEVDCWNQMHGIEVTDDVEEKLVEEMKIVQQDGDKRRAAIKQGFEAEENKLSNLDQELKDLRARIEATKAEAEKATEADLSENGVNFGIHEGSSGKVLAGKKSVNPFAEYKEQIQLLEGKASTAGGASLLKIDDSSARARVEKLRAESEVLKKCIKAGARGDFSTYSTTLAGK